MSETATFYSFLMQAGDEGTYTPYAPVKSTPSLIPEKEMIEVTNLSDSARRYIEGVQNTPQGLSFTCNYDPDLAKKVEKDKGVVKKWSVWLGGTASSDGTVTPTGAFGKFNFEGTISWSFNEQAVNAVREMTLKIAPSKAPYLAAEA